MKLVMVMKVRNEDDVLEDNLRYHRAQGVDIFIVTDNGSTDRTPEILRRYRDAGLLHLIEEPSEDFRNQAHWWVSRMGRLAATELGADWVVYADADEFWWPVTGTLKQALAEIPDRYGVVLAPRPEFVARPDGPGSFAQRLTVREARSRLRPKVAHRAHPDVVLHRGAHDVDVEREEGARPAGRAVLRALKPERFTQERLVWAPRWPARVFHFPVRSFEQYERRVEAALAGGFETKAHRELREHYEAGRLGELYEELVYDDEAVEQGVREGRLVRDTSFRDFLARCPDPLAGESAQAPRAGAPPDQVRGELEALELDAMATLARTQRSLIRQLDSFRDRVERQREKLERADRDRPWARFRSGAARALGRPRR